MCKVLSGTLLLDIKLTPHTLTIIFDSVCMGYLYLSCVPIFILLVIFLAIYQHVLDSETDVILKT